MHLKHWDESMNKKKKIFFLKITEKAKCLYFIPHYSDCLQDCLQAISSNKIQIFYSKPDREYIKEKMIYYKNNKPTAENYCTGQNIYFSTMDVSLSEIGNWPTTEYH